MLKLSRQWSFKIMEEFFQQGDLEKSSDLPVSFLCDRKTTKIPDAQSGFFQFCALPLYNAWGKLVQSSLSELMLQNIASNKDYWDQRIREAEKKEKERKRREELGENIDDVEDDDRMDSSDSEDGVTILPSITINTRIPKLTITTEDGDNGEVVTRDLFLDENDEEPTSPVQKTGKDEDLATAGASSIEPEGDEKLITVDFTQKILSEKVIKPRPFEKGGQASFERGESRRDKTLHFKIDDRKDDEEDDEEDDEDGLHLPLIVEKKKVEREDIFPSLKSKKKQASRDFDESDEKDDASPESPPSDLFLPEIPSASANNRFMPAQVRRLKQLTRKVSKPLPGSFFVRGERMNLLPRPPPTRKPVLLRRSRKPPQEDSSLSEERVFPTERPPPGDTASPFVSMIPRLAPRPTASREIRPIASSIGPAAVSRAEAGALPRREFREQLRTGRNTPRIKLARKTKDVKGPSGPKGK